MVGFNGIELKDQWWQYLVQREIWTLVMCLSPGPGSVGIWDCGRSEASVEGWRQSVVAFGLGLGDSSGLHSRYW